MSHTDWTARVPRFGRTVVVDGQEVRFWVVPADNLVRAPALVGTSEGRFAVLQEPSWYVRIGDYSDEDLSSIWRLHFG